MCAGGELGGRAWSGSPFEVRLHKIGGCWACDAVCFSSTVVFKQSSVAGHPLSLCRTAHAECLWSMLKFLEQC